MNTFLCVISDVLLTPTIISNLNTTTTLLYRCCSKRIYIGCMPVIDILSPVCITIALVFLQPLTQIFPAPTRLRYLPFIGLNLSRPP